ncbi:N-acetylneuraminate lyase isoform X2 [Dunckerocampus dactyliophorus]|uniref:N-acetylneuraminate lyase isoform X2 n=1 Tax=Dunckerocampus dactyliophorus TaxID=161453 RepID=UPI002406748C|nr:N-acetylneuraminate lyase isoform X2 [Dunckerocampus dactyliophorus]
MAQAVGKKLTGLVAATFTPFTSQGEVNLSEIGPYIDYLTEKQGVNSIFVNGTTGEGMSLSVAERKLLAEDWCRKAKGKMEQVIVHVGCTSLKDSQELARHAVEISADGIAVIAPSFFKPRSAVPARDLLEGIETLIPSFRGVKFSGSDLMDFGQCISHIQPHWSILYGVDEQLLAALVLGAHGAVGSTYNYLGSHMNKLVSEFDNGNLAQARNIQFKMQELISFAIKVGFDVGVNKQLMMEVSGLHLGPPRLPVMPCTKEHALSIKQKYQHLFPVHP